jgi:hypothetical protein
MKTALKNKAFKTPRIASLRRLKKGQFIIASSQAEKHRLLIQYMTRPAGWYFSLSIDKANTCRLTRTK